MSGVRRIPGGWGSHTFWVTGEHILRFARTPSVAAAHRREARLLPLLAPAVSFAVPVPDLFLDLGDCACIGYPPIVGRPLVASDDWRSLAGVLRELHSFSVDVAREVLGSDDWRGYYERLWIDVTERVLPVLEPDLRGVLVREYLGFLGGGWDFAPVLVHRDLAAEHILVDSAGRVVGLIDFEDAAVGDPAVDFAGLLGVLGWERTSLLLADYGLPVDVGRLRCYWWLVPVHDLLHGLTTGDQAIIDTAVDELRERLILGGREFPGGAATGAGP